MTEPKIVNPPVSPQVSGLNGTSARDSAFQTNHQRSNLLASLGANKGGNRRRGKCGGNGKILVPNTAYPGMPDPSARTSQGVVPQTSGVVATGSKTNMDATYDDKVVLVTAPKGTITKVGGSRRTKRRGGFVWPCMSGGKTRKTRKSRKSKKSKKSKKARKSRRH